LSSLYAEQLSFTYSSEDWMVLKSVDLKIESGQMVAIVGPNGSGKTTFLRLASGVLRPTKGKILLDKIDLKDLSRNKIAQRVAMVPQYFYMPFSFTVAEVVMMGRTPFIKLLGGEKEHDRDAVHYSMESTGVSEFESRLFNDLSGGERQRAILALAMAQEPKLLLLDEPTAHLDINHQIELLQLVRKLNQDEGITIAAVMHDLNLASIYFDRIIILKNGSVYADGSPQEVLTADTIQHVYGTQVHVTTHPTTGTPYVIALPKP
jgi:iron complex transport system ATP-binding protein